MAIDPRALLGLEPRVNPFEGLPEKLRASRAAQTTEDINQEKLSTIRQTKQDDAENREFKRIEALYDPADPTAFIDAANASDVFDDESKAEFEQFRDNPQLFQGVQSEVNRLLGIKPGTPVALGEGDVLVAPVTGQQIAQGPAAAAPEIPITLLSGLSPELADKGAAAFRAAGGGKDGMKAFTSIIDKGSEQERRLTSPKLINQAFPQASQAENRQLQAAMDSAKTTESGLRAAGKVRAEQKRLKKAKSFQNDAVTLLQGIVSHPELGDVLGSVEGAIDFRLQDSESELIADIEQATNILTADNMDLMTGVLSESDIAILKSISGGGLNRKRTKKRFIADVQKMIDKLSAVPVSTVDDDTARNIPIFNPQTGEFE